VNYIKTGTQLHSQAYTARLINFYWPLEADPGCKQPGYSDCYKNKRVGSFIHLARMAFRHEPELLNWDLFQKVIRDLQQQYHSFISALLP